jgi:hypothetical protein
MSTPFDGLAAGVSPADGAASRRAPEENSFDFDEKKDLGYHAGSADLNRGRRAVGLFFRQFRPYIGPWTAAAKAVPAGKCWTPSHAERHL